jgi:DNA-binding MarR family transcriptional regulator
MSTATPAKSMDAWGYFLLAHARATEELNRRAAAAGFPSIEWYDVLWALERAGDRHLRMSEVADMLTVSRSNFTRLLDRLEDAGLATRARSDQDRRSTYAVITPEGKKLRKKMWVMYEQAIHDIFLDHLTEKEAAAMAEGLRKVLVNLRGEPSA